MSKRRPLTDIECQAISLCMDRAQTRDANDYYDRTIQDLHMRNKSLHGFGFPISADHRNVKEAKRRQAPKGLLAVFDRAYGVTE